MSKASLKLSDLSCIRSERVLFSQLSLSVRAGEALLVRGPNGSGKSSFLRLLAGVLPPAAGKVELGGVDIAQDRESYVRQLSYWGHQDALKPELTVRQNFRQWQHLRGQAEESDALARCGLADLGHIPARLLSAGQKRRFGFARLVASGAALWLMDEPLTALDADGQSLVVQETQNHLESGGLAVIALHDDFKVAPVQTLYLGQAV